MENGRAARKKLGRASKKGEKEERKVIQLIYAEEEPIVCLRNMDMKKIEETQDCFILGFDPSHSEDVPITETNADLHVISQKGQVHKITVLWDLLNQCVDVIYDERECFDRLFV